MLHAVRNDASVRRRIFTRSLSAMNAREQRRNPSVHRWTGPNCGALPHEWSPLNRIPTLAAIVWTCVAACTSPLSEADNKAQTGSPTSGAARSDASLAPMNVVGADNAARFLSRDGGKPTCPAGYFAPDCEPQWANGTLAQFAWPRALDAGELGDRGMTLMDGGILRGPRDGGVRGPVTH